MKDDREKFYKMPIQNRIDFVNEKSNAQNKNLTNKLEYHDLITGGLKLDVANTMTENVVGLLSLPLSVVPEFIINKKKIMIPMCVE